MMAHEILKTQLATSVLSRPYTKLFFLSKGWYAFWSCVSVCWVLVSQLYPVFNIRETSESKVVNVQAVIRFVMVVVFKIN